MIRTRMLLCATLAVALSSCKVIAADADEPPKPARRVDAESLLAQVRDVLPEGWEALLYWDPRDTELTPKPLPVNWMEDKWRSWLPGMDGRHIEVRRKKAVAYTVDASGPDPDGHYVREEVEYLRFALTTGEAKPPDEVGRRLSELNEEITRLETLLKPSRYRQLEDGFVQHSVPRDLAGRRALQQYDQLWTIKRWFPQWSAGGLSVGFRCLIQLRMLPEDAKADYRDVKRKVIGILHPARNWQYIPADEE